jgi:hypothetical protein
MRRIAVAASLIATLGLAAQAQAQSNRYDELANSPMVENRPTPLPS